MSGLIIQYAVVHELIKEQHQPIAPNNMRPTLLDPSNDVVVKLLGDIIAIYGTRHNSAHYGVFKSSDGQGTFPKSFAKYCAEPNVLGLHFMAISKIAMEQLYIRAESELLASGGYIFFADYLIAGLRYLMVAMIKKTPGMTMNAALEPEELQRLDLDRLHQAARINFSRYAEYNVAEERKRSEVNYLTFISPNRNSSAAGYFIKALGCAEGATSARATKALFDQTSNFFKENAELRPNRDNFRNALINYLTSKDGAKQSAKLSDIRQLVLNQFPAELADKAEEMVDALISKLNSEQCGVPVEFPPSRSEIKRRTHLKVTANHWRLEFDRDALGATNEAAVYFDKESNTLTLREIPAELQSVLTNELAEKVRSNADED